MPLTPASSVALHTSIHYFYFKPCNLVVPAARRHGLAGVVKELKALYPDAAVAPKGTLAAEATDGSGEGGAAGQGPGGASAAKMYVPEDFVTVSKAQHRIAQGQQGGAGTWW